jgi:hypothetical protein
MGLVVLDQVHRFEGIDAPGLHLHGLADSRPTAARKLRA